MTTTIIPVAETIEGCNNFFVNNFVAYIKANNFPLFNTDELLFATSDGRRLSALCTLEPFPSDFIREELSLCISNPQYVNELNEQQVSSRYGSEHIYATFDDVAYNQWHRDFFVLIGEHLYFFNF